MREGGQSAVVAVCAPPLFFFGVSRSPRCVLCVRCVSLLLLLLLASRSSVHRGPHTLKQRGEVRKKERRQRARTYSAKQNRVQARERMEGRVSCTVSECGCMNESDRTQPELHRNLRSSSFCWLFFVLSVE